MSKKLLVLVVLVVLVLAACGNITKDDSCVTGLAKQGPAGNTCLTKAEVQELYDAAQTAAKYMTPASQSVTTVSTSASQATSVPTIVPPTKALPAPTTAPVVSCGCPTSENADTFEKPMNTDDNQALVLQNGLYDVEDTRLQSDIRQNGSGVHVFYVLYVPQGQTYAIPAYTSADGRRRVWQFNGNPSPEAALCHVRAEAQQFAKDKANTPDTVVWFFNEQLLDTRTHNENTTGSSNADTFEKPMNTDDNQALVLQNGLYDVEDTRLQSDIRQNGSGVHVFYVLYVPQGQTYAIPAYTSADGRRRVWQFNGNPSPEAALCHVRAEAQQFAKDKANTPDTVVWFDSSLLLSNR